MRVFTEGNVAIDFVRDDAFSAPGSLLFPDAQDLATEAFELDVGTHVVRVGAKVLLVDLGIGEGKTRPYRPSWHMRSGTGFLSRLGISRHDVSMVLFTHLHADHVGWATLPDGTPTFPNARHIVSAEDLNTTRQRTLSARDPTSVGHGSYLDCIAPLEALGLIEPVAMDAELAPGCQLIPAPGHTPGQIMLQVGRAILSADVLHHPVQIARPELVSGFCSDGTSAIRTRKSLLARARAAGLALLPSHFGLVDFAA
jgi:glyoxylase-like metal-dependent hydrolase (beta-lactamase superfamily II)